MIHASRPKCVTLGCISKTLRKLFIGFLNVVNSMRRTIDPYVDITFIPVCFYCITFYHSVFTIVRHSRPFSVCMTGHYNTFLSLSISLSLSNSLKFANFPKRKRITRIRTTICEECVRIMHISLPGTQRDRFRSTSCQ